MRQPTDAGPTGLEPVLARVRDSLGSVPGVVALALGGSRARGTAYEDSDVDIGLYYEPARRPDFDELYAAAAELDDRGVPDGYGSYGEWGPWVNGGLWLQVAGKRMDILLRDTARVRRVLQECADGEVDVFYQVGHPHGFCSASYAGEVHHNVGFFDPGGTLAALRELTEPYPEPLGRAITRRFAWEAGFTLDSAGSAARRGDAAYVSGCAFRVIACLTQVVFAAERRYLTNEKGSVALADRFSSAPPGYGDRVAAAVTRLSGSPEELTAVLTTLRSLHEAVLARVGHL